MKKAWRIAAVYCSVVSALLLSSSLGSRAVTVWSESRPTDSQHCIVIDPGCLDRFAPGTEMMNGCHIQRFAVVLNILTGKRISFTVSFADRGDNTDTGPSVIFADCVVVKAAGGDRISPGPENTLCRRIDTWISRRKIMRIQRFFPIERKNDISYHIGCPNFLKHLIQKILFYQLNKKVIYTGLIFFANTLL